MIASIILEHTAPFALIVLAVLAAIGVSAWLFWRYMGHNRVTLLLGALRLVFFLLLLWCFFQPSRKTSDTQILKPRFLVVVDVSASMDLAPAEETGNRWSVVRRVMELPWVRSVAQQSELEIYPVDRQVGAQVSLDELAELRPEGDASWLRDSLTRLSDRYRGQPVEGCLLLSDGLDTRETDDQWAAREWSFPIYTVRIEEEAVWDVEPDVRVETVETPRRVLVGWDTDLKVALSGQGTRGEPVAVQLFERGQLVDETDVRIPAEGGRREILFRLTHDEIGARTFVVVVPALPEESHTNDNTHAVSVQVVDAQNRLLYAENTPRWEFKFLKRALKANQSVNSLIFLRGPGGKFLTMGQRGMMTLDMTPDQLNQFKIVILGNFSATELGAERARALTEFVEGGGSLLVLGGEQAWGSDGLITTPLGAVLPVLRPVAPKPSEGRFPIRVTDEGLSHQAFLGDAGSWDRLPPLLSVFGGSAPKSGSTTLVSAQTDEGDVPVVVSQRYGAGKIAVVLSDSIWRWQLNPDEDKPYQRFWNQMILWMLPEDSEVAEDSVELFADRGRVFMGEPITFSARVGLREDSAEDVRIDCRVEAPGGRELVYPMRRADTVTAAGRTIPSYGATHEAAERGLHTITASAVIGGRMITSDPLTVFVNPYLPEADPRPANVELLRALASASGGVYTSIDRIDTVLSRISFRQIDEERVTYASLWKAWPVILCLMTLLSLEWTLRKHHNMA